MPRVIEAVYENGVFKPLEKVKLKEGERVKIKIENKENKKEIISKVFGRIKIERDKLEKIIKEAEEEFYAT